MNPLARNSRRKIFPMAVMAGLGSYIEGHGIYRTADAHIHLRAFELGLSGDVRHCVRRVVRVSEPALSRHLDPDRCRNPEVGRVAALLAGSGGGGHRGGPRRLGLVLARSPLWRRDRPDLAVHAQSGPVAERHPVFSEARRKERLYRPIFRPGAGCDTARRRHHAHAPRPVLVRQCYLGDRLGADAAVRRRCRRRCRRPPDWLRQYGFARLWRSDRVRHHCGGVGNGEVRQIEIVREDEWPRSFHLTATNSSASEPAFPMSQSPILGRTPTMSWTSLLRATRPASP